MAKIKGIIVKKGNVTAKNLYTPEESYNCMVEIKQENNEIAAIRLTTKEACTELQKYNAGQEVIIDFSIKSENAVKKESGEVYENLFNHELKGQSIIGAQTAVKKATPPVAPPPVENDGDDLPY